MENIDVEALFDDGFFMGKTATNLIRIWMTFVKESNVDTVYISYKDRLTWFGFDYFDYIFNFLGQKLKW